MAHKGAIFYLRATITRSISVRGELIWCRIRRLPGKKKRGYVLRRRSAFCDQRLDLPENPPTYPPFIWDLFWFFFFCIFCICVLLFLGGTFLILVWILFLYFLFWTLFLDFVFVFVVWFFGGIFCLGNYKGAENARAWEPRCPTLCIPCAYLAMHTLWHGSNHPGSPTLRTGRGSFAHACACPGWSRWEETSMRSDARPPGGCVVSSLGFGFCGRGTKTPKRWGVLAGDTKLQCTGRGSVAHACACPGWSLGFPNGVPTGSQRGQQPPGSSIKHILAKICTRLSGRGSIKNIMNI